MKILILGGYGVFGGRLAELLSDIDGIELLICGRNLSRAQTFCATYKGKAQVRPLALDRADIASGLEIEAPDLVVDASGPFQAYGTDQYSVITACIAARIDYLDFADAADFVFGVSQFDAKAKAAGVFVLSGVSSFPVLTAAVLREMAKTMDIVSVKGGIAPSPFAGIGLNVMRAVIGYAGSPVKLWRDGRPAHGVGLAESLRFTVAVPGRLLLRNIRFSLVDVPDLQVIPPEHPAMNDIWMGAGPVPKILHRSLNLLAKARATLHLPSLAPLSRLFYMVLNAMRFGEHRGGMFVSATGIAAGKRREQSWHLLATFCMAESRNPVPDRPSTPLKSVTMTPSSLTERSTPGFAAPRRTGRSIAKFSGQPLRCFRPGCASCTTALKPDPGAGQPTSGAERDGWPASLRRRSISRRPEVMSRSRSCFNLATTQSFGRAPSPARHSRRCRLLALAKTTTCLSSASAPSPYRLRLSSRGKGSCWCPDGGQPSASRCRELFCRTESVLRHRPETCFVSTSRSPLLSSASSSPTKERSIRNDPFDEHLRHRRNCVAISTP